MPDGMINVKESNKEKFDYKLQINDYLYYQYHRNNGITKIGIVHEKETEDDLNTGNTTHITTPIQGSMSLSDKMNNAYIRSVFNDTYVVSG